MNLPSVEEHTAAGYIFHTSGICVHSARIIVLRVEPNRSGLVDICSCASIDILVWATSLQFGCETNSRPTFSYSFGFCQSYNCCKSMCYTHCFLFSRPWNPVYQTQQVSKNVTISYFHHCPPFNLLCVICMATERSVLQSPLIFFPPLSRKSCWCECNFWSTLEVAGEFRPAAALLCST